MTSTPKSARLIGLAFVVSMVASAPAVATGLGGLAEKLKAASRSVDTTVKSDVVPEVPSDPGPASASQPPVAPIVETKVGTPVGPSPAATFEDERAREVLALEQKQAGQAHPLQLARPNDNVIVCEAGCGGSKAHVISIQPKALMVSLAADPAAASTPVVEATGTCFAGCGQARLRAQAVSRPVEPAERLESKATGQASHAPIAPAVTAVPSVVPTPWAPTVVPAARGSREDWMARINRDRASRPGKSAEASEVGPAGPAGDASR